MTPLRSKERLDQRFLVAYGCGPVGEKIVVFNPNPFKVRVQKGKKVAEFHPSRDFIRRQDREQERKGGDGEGWTLLLNQVQGRNVGVVTEGKVLGDVSDRKNFEATDTSGRTGSHRVGVKEWNNACESLTNGEEPLKLDTTSSSPRNGARPLVLDTRITQSGKAPGDQQSVPGNEERNKGGGLEDLEKAFESEPLCDVD